MERFSAARKILETFKDGKTFLCLRDLAHASGFPRASSRNFKDGFNYLVTKGVLKLRQSGWPSEKRGGKNHPKTVILTANIYEVVDSDFTVDPDKIINLDKRFFSGLQKTFSESGMLSKLRKEKYSSCENCKRHPVVYITHEKIGVCKKHWKQLASSTTEW